MRQQIVAKTSIPTFERSVNDVKRTFFSDQINDNLRSGAFDLRFIIVKLKLTVNLCDFQGLSKEAFATANLTCPWFRLPSW